MKLAFPLMLLASAVSTVVASDKESIQAYQKIGVCAYYPKDPLRKTELTEACNVYCKNQPNSKLAGCDTGKGGALGGGKVTDAAWNERKKDDKGEFYIIAPCFCENAVIEYIAENVMEVVAQGLQNGFKVLGQLFCTIGMNVMQTAAEAGLAAIPGGQTLVAAKYAVKTAKTFAENGLKAADYMDWIGKVCGTPPGYNAFDVLLGSDLDKSEGCFKKQSKCDAPTAPKKKGARSIDDFPTTLLKAVRSVSTPTIPYEY